jgi:hypothetical protein
MCFLKSPYGMPLHLCASDNLKLTTPANFSFPFVCYHVLSSMCCDSNAPLKLCHAFFKNILSVCVCQHCIFLIAVYVCYVLPFSFHWMPHTYMTYEQIDHTRTHQNTFLFYFSVFPVTMIYLFHQTPVINYVTAYSWIPRFYITEVE